MGAELLSAGRTDHQAFSLQPKSPGPEVAIALCQNARQHGVQLLQGAHSMVPPQGQPHLCQPHNRLRMLHPKDSPIYSGACTQQKFCSALLHMLMVIHLHLQHNGVQLLQRVHCVVSSLKQPHLCQPHYCLRMLHPNHSSIDPGHRKISAVFYRTCCLEFDHFWLHTA